MPSASATRCTSRSSVMNEMIRIADLHWGHSSGSNSKILFVQAACLMVFCEYRGAPLHPIAALEGVLADAVATCFASPASGRVVAVIPSH